MEETPETRRNATNTLPETLSASLMDKSSDVCVICLSAISERAIIVPCNHYTFDFICLASWLQERSACPLCKSEVTAVQYDWRSPTDFKTYNVQSTLPRPKTAEPTAPRAETSRTRFPFRPNRPRPTAQRFSSPNPDIAFLRRRHIYRHDLYSLHVGSNRVSRYRNLTPALVSNSPDLQSRARMWIRRELRVFTFLNPNTDTSSGPGSSSDNSHRSNNAEFLLEYIIAILKTVDIKDSSGHAEEMLQEFLGRGNTRLFLHELSAWLRSPYTKLEDWDRHVQYKEALPYRFDETGRGLNGREKANACLNPTHSQNPITIPRGAVLTRSESKARKAQEKQDSHNLNNQVGQ
ncbi:hypothetical protein K432DRAFT_415352 [Lepidopterella palustris CBS 459.81]|uniref:RING-type E3 ubiquitin transferase n=1 Tax=Lepidopterella palustris CBS 459.81 TaxID=1314670 RepID=A0A8E2JHE6_9PEZI|nr:hypothetical protein K432DRAFT_415352 [Lepidopterella palustris CBS 459.81]